MEIVGVKHHDKKQRKGGDEQRQQLNILLSPKQASLTQLTSVDIRFQNLSEVPKSLCECINLTKLDMGNNRLNKLPKDLAKLENLKILFLTLNEFEVIPPILKSMKRLTMLSLKKNKIIKAECENLPVQIEWLIMTENKISDITNIGRLTSLRKCMFSHNRLSEIPNEIKHCKKLEMLRLADNQFENFPKNVFLPPRISWLAISGNPCTKQFVAADKKQASTMVNVDYGDLEFAENLGSGSGGNVRVATWRSKKQRVAVKEYKETSFSDGTAKDEWTINQILPSQAHILSSLGTFSKPHLGLVLELMEGAGPVGGPPSFETCTRDNMVSPLTPTCALKVAMAVCDACRHLHKHGIAHGDIYLHNTLADRKGNVKLTDFGAAYFYPEELRPWIEGLEVRSFGFLLDDLIRFTKTPDSNPDLAKKAAMTLNSLKALARQCMEDGDPAEHPSFEALAKSLTVVGLNITLPILFPLPEQ